MIAGHVCAELKKAKYPRSCLAGHSLPDQALTLHRLPTFYFQTDELTALARLSLS
jgi:hypothetical protein